jgi:hypothetical protein
VITDSQSYKNLLYLLLGLPLGVLYFTVLVTGISVGVGLIVVALIGIVILIGLWYVIRAFMHFERGLAIGLLDVTIAPISPLPESTGGLWQRFKTFMADRPTWIGVWYLFLRFAAGIATFTIAVTLIAVSLGLTFSPTWMWTSNDLEWGSWTFDPFPWSFLAAPIGIILVFLSLHALNALARACGRWARASLGGRAAD